MDPVFPVRGQAPTSARVDPHFLAVAQRPASSACQNGSRARPELPKPAKMADPIARALKTCRNGRTGLPKWQGHGGANGGRESSKLNSDCTICVSCRWKIPGCIVPRQRENGSEWRECRRYPVHFACRTAVVLALARADHSFDLLLVCPQWSASSRRNPHVHHYGSHLRTLSPSRIVAEGRASHGQRLYQWTRASVPSWGGST